MKQTFYEIFRELNRIPRPSHHEERVADWLCQFAEKQGLNYRRDKNNCVVIEKPATPGYEDAAPVVILNHMDMVCVAKDGYLRNGHKFDPMTDEILPYVETDANGERWMKAEGTSLGADNGVGLSMALAILTDDELVHPALEVLTTTNEEDGMSGAEGLSLDFIKGRKILNLDSEAYDEITVGAAGAQLQVAHWTPEWAQVNPDSMFYRVVIDGGLGGHSGVDINKGRCNCNKEIAQFIIDVAKGDVKVCAINGGTANASIPSWAEMIVAVTPEFAKTCDITVNRYNTQLKAKYGETDPDINLRIEVAEPCDHYLANAKPIIDCIAGLPCNALAMRDDMPGTVMSSNNIGMVCTKQDDITVSCHTRSFSNDEMHRLAADIKEKCLAKQATTVECLMDTGSWMENPDSQMLSLAYETFNDVLGFYPKKVAMHFVLEAAYYVEKYPGVEMASIGPRIIEPHSTSERISLDTADNIWKVAVEVLRRCAVQK